MVVGVLRVADYGKFQVLTLLVLSPVGLNMINSSKHIYPWWIRLSVSIFINVGVVIAVLLLYQVGPQFSLGLLLADTLWQALHLAFLAGHFCPGWCSGLPHLMHFPSIPGGFLL